MVSFDYGKKFQGKYRIIKVFSLLRAGGGEDKDLDMELWFEILIQIWLKFLIFSSR